MDNREKVIKGLKCCFQNANCDGCPYEIECRKISLKTPETHCPILDDILALLKEQEAVPVIQREFMHMLVWCCGSCGKPITDGDKFCRMCGKKVKWNGFD